MIEFCNHNWKTETPNGILWSSLREPDNWSKLNYLKLNLDPDDEISWLEKRGSLLVCTTQKGRVFHLEFDFNYMGGTPFVVREAFAGQHLFDRYRLVGNGLQDDTEAILKMIADSEPIPDGVYRIKTAK